MPTASRFRLAAALAAAVASPALATTIVPVTDAKLVDHSPLVVEVTVESKLPTVLDRPVTDWLVVVERVLKGDLGTSKIVVRLPGGEAPDGRGLYIWGTPPLAPGRKAILFLAPRPGDTYAVVDFPQGAFLAGKSHIRELAFRDLSQVRVLHRGSVGMRDRFRDSRRFADWIEDRARGYRRPADYLVTPRGSEIQSLAKSFTLFEEDGLNFRWFQFDSGGSVAFQSHSGGQPGLDGGGTTELQNALSAWNNELTTPLRLVYGGISDSTGGLETFDSQNVVLWNDPEDEIAGKFNCSQGGTVAHGGPWYDTASRGKFNGKTYYRIQGGDVVLNDGIECRAAFSPSFSEFIEEVTAHEIGHTLGLGHSSEKAIEMSSVKRQALMYFRAHDDGRGARLNSDDIAGLQTLYRVGGASGGGGGTGNCPANHLCLLNGRFQVSATWQNQFDGSSGDAGAVPSTNFAGFLYFTSPTNIELAVKILDFGSEIKVFYSQLTNLRFTLRVTDTFSGRVKTYSNTAGECGAIDDNFLTGQAAASSAGMASLSLPSIVGGKCVADSSTLCLLGTRFAVTVDWRNQFDDASGTGKPRTLSNLSGAFAFQDPANLELLIKTLDFGDRVLVLYGALSNLEYAIHVTEAATGRTKTYSNPAGKFCGGIDNAF